MTKRLSLAARAARINETKPYGGRGLDKLGEISAVPALPDQLLHDARVAVCDRANGPDDARNLLEHLGLTQPAPLEAPVVMTPGPRAPHTPRPDDTWMADAACRDMPVDQFFSPEGETGQRRAQRSDTAKKICARCPVRRACLEWALDTGQDWGVWGGTTEDERRTEKRRRARRKAA